MKLYLCLGNWLGTEIYLERNPDNIPYFGAAKDEVQVTFFIGKTRLYILSGQFR